MNTPDDPETLTPANSAEVSSGDNLKNTIPLVNPEKNIGGLGERLKNIRTLFEPMTILGQKVTEEGKVLKPGRIVGHVGNAVSPPKPQSLIDFYNKNPDEVPYSVPEGAPELLKALLRPLQGQKSLLS